MKSKLTVPKRNPFVCLVLKKTGAGSHRKPNKAVRKQVKQRGYDEIGLSYRTFNPAFWVRVSVPLPQLPYWNTLRHCSAAATKTRVVCFNMVVYTINTRCQGSDSLSLFCYPQTGEKYTHKRSSVGILFLRPEDCRPIIRRQYAALFRDREHIEVHSIY